MKEERTDKLGGEVTAMKRKELNSSGNTEKDLEKDEDAERESINIEE